MKSSLLKIIQVKTNNQPRSEIIGARTTRGEEMKVKDLIKSLSQFDKNLDVVFYNNTLDENHWGCELNIDDVNGKDLIIVPTIED